MDAVTVVPQPANEPVHDYASGSPERSKLKAKLDELASTPTEIQQVIGGVTGRPRATSSRWCSRTGTRR